MEKLLDRLFLFLFIAGFCAIGAWGAMRVLPKVQRMKGLEQERDRILQRIEDKKKEIASIRDKQRKFTSDREFVEMIARENRLLSPGELVFIFKQ